MAHVFGGAPLFSTVGGRLFGTAPLFGIPADALVVTNAEVTAWLATLAVKPPQAYVTALDAFVTGTKADGTFALLKEIWQPWCPVLPGALTRLITPAGTVATMNGGVTWQPYRGFTGDLTSGYVNTGVTPAALGIAQNSEFLFGYILTNTASNTYSFGSNISALIARRSTGNNVSGNSQTATVTTGVAGTMTTSVGLSGINRSGSTNFIFSKNGVDYETLTRASTGVGADNIMICARGNGAGAATGFDNRQVGLVGIGSAFTLAQRGTFNTRVQAFATAIGAA